MGRVKDETTRLCTCLTEETLAFLPLVTASLFSSVAVSADEGLAALAFPPGMYFAASW